MKALRGESLEEYLKWLGVFLQLVSFKVGDGTRIRFWHDLRCGKVALKYSYPKLYLIARNKEALVSDYLDSSNSYVHWNLSFIRAIQNWKPESLDSFLNLLYSSKTYQREVDRMLWTVASSHGFEVRSYYKTL